MRLIIASLALLCCATATAGQSPAPNAADNAAAQTQDSATRPQIHTGMRVFIKAVDTIGGTPTSIQTRVCTKKEYADLFKAFEKSGRFPVVENLDDAGFVFWVVRHGSKGITGAAKMNSYSGAAVLTQDYKENSRWVNPFRGDANPQGMLAAAQWTGEKNASFAKHMAIGLATLSIWEGGGVAHPTSLVEEFLKDIP